MKGSWTAIPFVLVLVCVAGLFAANTTQPGGSLLPPDIETGAKFRQLRIGGESFDGATVDKKRGSWLLLKHEGQLVWVNLGVATSLAVK